MFDKVIPILAAIFVLGLMVTIHELGHFIAARWFKVRVDVFSFGFGTRLFGVKRGNTDYSVRILPFGGYVRMAGDNPSEERSGAPDEFLSKPRWQRFIIALAGPVMNLITALVVFTILFTGSVQEPAYYNKPVLVAGVADNSPAQKAGIQPGDQITEINGYQNPTWQRLHWEASLGLPGSFIPITVQRDGASFQTNVQASLDEFQSFGYPSMKILVDRLSPGQGAQRAGLRPGDELVSVNHQSITFLSQASDIIQKAAGHPVEITVRRGDHDFSVPVHPARMDTADGERWMIGAVFAPHEDTETVHYNIFEAAGLSAWLNTRLSEQILGVLGELFTSKWSQVLKEVQGPVGIVAASGRAARQGPRDLFSLMAIISLNLGLLNLLPIPILDGGHIVMLGVESVMRRDLSIRAKELFLQVGMVFILILLAVVMYHDIVRLFPHQ
jgi:regulator of sigma E protease